MYSEPLCQREDGREGGIAPAGLDGADVVRRQPRALRELLDREAQSLAPSPDLLAEVHGAEGRGVGFPREPTIGVIYNSIVLVRETIMNVQRNDGSARGQNNGAGWWRAPVVVVSLGLALLLGPGCKKTPVIVKLDTPETAASTVLNLYAAKQTAGLEEVVDPALVRREIRAHVCGPVITQTYKCSEELLRSRLEGTSPSRACMEAPRARDCTCGERGEKAIAEAEGFLASDAHGALRDAQFDAAKCTVGQARELDESGTKSAISYFSETLCGDATAKDHFSAVDIKCGTTPTPFTIVLRESDGKWRLFAIDQKTLTRWVFARHE